MGKRVFIVEDELDIAELYRAYFDRAGFEIEIAQTGKRALEMVQAVVEVKTAAPDVVVLDLLLPDISGLAVLDEMRKQKAFNAVPVIILTNYVSDKLTESLKKIPLVDYFSKLEMSPSELVEVAKQKVA